MKPDPVRCVLRSWIFPAVVVFAATGGSARAGQFDLLVTSYVDGQVDRFDGATGTALGTFARLGALTRPTGLEFGPDGNLYVVSSTHGSILRFDGRSGAFIDLFAGGQALDQPLDLAFGPDDILYVSNGGSTNRIAQFDSRTGAFRGSFGAPDLRGATGLEFAPDGILLVVSAGEVQRYRGRAFIGSIGGPELVRPADVAFGPDDNLYVSNLYPPSILRYDAGSGLFIDTFVGNVDVLEYPVGIVFGPDGNLYVADHELGQIVRFDGRTGAFIDFFAETRYPAFPIFVPGPGTLWLFAVGALLVLKRERRALARSDGVSKS